MTTCAFDKNRPIQRTFTDSGRQITIRLVSDRGLVRRSLKKSWGIVHCPDGRLVLSNTGNREDHLENGDTHTTTA